MFLLTWLPVMDGVGLAGSRVQLRARICQGCLGSSGTNAQGEPAWAPAHRQLTCGRGGCLREAALPPLARLGSGLVHLDWGA